MVLLLKSMMVSSQRDKSGKWVEVGKGGGGGIKEVNAHNDVVLKREQRGKEGGGEDGGHRQRQSSRGVGDEVHDGFQAKTEEDVGGKRREGPVGGGGGGKKNQRSPSSHDVAAEVDGSFKSEREKRKEGRRGGRGE